MLSKSFHIITFGCQMNVHDSQWIKSALQQKGFVEAPLEEARTIIINTCSVRKKPEEKVRSLLGRIKLITRNSSETIIVICGCVAQQHGNNLFAWSKQVRLVAGTDVVDQIPDYLEQLLNYPEKRLLRLDFSKNIRERQDFSTNNVSAMVSIMQGCDNFCSYCIVPFTRGRQKSRLKSHIISECKKKLLAGAKEITLLGQNVNAWGKDNGQQSFAELIREIASLPNLLRLRYITPHPRDMGREDLQVFEEFSNIQPHLHLPLQSGSDKILADMRRRYNFEEYLNLISELRNLRPDITFTTDIIVGFPGETEEDFNCTLEALNECGFINSFSFCYSDRPGARACLFPDKVPAEIQHDRLARYQQAQAKLTENWLSSRIGTETIILLENKSPIQEKDKNTWQGRDEHGIIVHVNMSENIEHAGKLIKCRIKKANKHSLVAYTPNPSV